MYEDYEKILDELKHHSHFRDLKNFEKKDEKYIYFRGKKLLNLSSNNYLNFADNKKITQEFLDFAGNKYSFGSASARLLTGTLPVYKELEELLSNLYNKDATLLYNSGYHANVGISSAINQKGDVIFSDKLNHASIIDGMRLSDGKFFRFPHNNMEALEKLLERERKNYKNAFIITESVFSMDGDIEDLKRIIKLKKKYNCIMIIDEAHAFGVFGEKGLGVAEELGIIDDVDLIVGTFGKSVGSMGAFVTGSKTMINFLINKSRSFIFSTALPPINIAFTKWIIENQFPKTKAKRKNMLSIAKKMGSDSHIIPVVIGDNKDTVDLCEVLFHNGYFTLPIRPPTVPVGTSRLRLSLTTDIQEKDLTVLKEKINEVLLAK
ncbi:TPA: 8-amino-7-oxononanoate synthase [Candidatus Gastranaerophilales bacterium HUM_6]|nr:8-amino-7-oxononanoate synthase [Fusobacterium sp. CAG:815]DAA93253.1 MAG TPA: 8-amino-7-oxononanoate synthase [Candidatus Gastranaerophilales bacterium HUM_6]DAA93482.1 MAG TPA: 8-amino-7-oxononanoate synthase [Candidatus Gastranaerophilales bacterium HUM_7]DAB08734.1 MAG TPA: 8-amino-7-oxononanoate synthase [Candidatus Gastranaerophilales bacterium HUM_14]